MKTYTNDGFNKKRSENTNNEKKPFNKKQYRLKKYSNKYKINQWEERRKQAVLRSFYKELDRSGELNLKTSTVLKNDTNHNENNPRKISAFKKAKEEFMRKKEEEKKRKEEALQRKAEQEKAVKEYKEKRMQAYKKLSKKTKKGQPVMKERIELLLDKIQEQVAN